MVALYPIKRATTKICLEKMRDVYFKMVGKPSRILSDNGTQFASPGWRTMLESWGISVSFSSVRHLHSNSVERTMRELGRIFRTYCSEKHTEWARHILFVQKILNYNVHDSTEAVPYELHFGRVIDEKIYEMFPKLKRSLEDRKYQIEIANERLRKAFEQRSKKQVHKNKVDLEIGDLVLVRVSHLSNANNRQIYKFFYLYEGPFEINKKMGNNAFELVLVFGSALRKGIFYRFHLKSIIRLLMFLIELSFYVYNES